MSRLNPLSGMDAYATEVREGFKSLVELLVLNTRAQLAEDNNERAQLRDDLAAEVSELCRRGHL